MSVGENRPKDNCLLPALTIFEFYKQYVAFKSLEPIINRTHTHSVYPYGICSIKNSKLSDNNTDLSK